MSNGYLVAASADLATIDDIADGFGLDVIAAHTITDREAVGAALAGAANVGVVLSLAAAREDAFVALLQVLAGRLKRAQLILVEPDALRALAFLPALWPTMSLEEALARAQAMIASRKPEPAGEQPSAEAPAPVSIEPASEPQPAAEEPPSEAPVPVAAEPAPVVEPEIPEPPPQAQSESEPPQQAPPAPAAPGAEPEIPEPPPQTQSEAEPPRQEPPSPAVEPAERAPTDGAGADIADEPVAASDDHAVLATASEGQTAPEPAHRDAPAEPQPQAPDDIVIAQNEEAKHAAAVDANEPAPAAPAPEAPEQAPAPASVVVGAGAPQAHDDEHATLGEPPPPPARKRAEANQRADHTAAPADATAFAPKKLRRGEAELVRIAIHQPKDLQAVIKAARKADPRTTSAPQSMGIGEVALGSSVGVALEVKGAACDGAVQRRIWEGEPLEFSFAATADAEVKQVVILARVLVDDAQIGVLAFTRAVTGPSPKALADGERVRLKRHKRVFLSYSSKDRETVSAIATAYAMAGIEHFWDRASLKSGEEWSPRLRREIERADLFHLCWSKAAAQSAWVEKETSHAIALRRSKKRPDISVQMLDGPPWAKHPDSLDAINFDDFVRAAIVGYARVEAEA